MKITGYYTTQEAIEKIGVTQQRIQKLSKDYGWRFEKIGNARLFLAQDVDAYESARWHFKALKELGLIKGAERPVFDVDFAPDGWRGEILNDDYEIQCPKCQARYAVCLPDGSKGICRSCGPWESPQANIA